MKNRLGIILAAALAVGAGVVLLLVERAPVALLAPDAAQPALPEAAPALPSSAPLAARPAAPAAKDASFGATPAATAPRAPRRSTAASASTPTAAAPPDAPSAPADAAMPAERTATPEEIEQVRIELDQVGLMLRDYRTRMGENPWGTNAEIMKAVMGANPVQAKLGPPEGQQLNGDGELVDRWGTPYFFHQLSATQMEIHSAGPDKKRGTNDDIIHR